MENLPAEYSSGLDLSTIFSRAIKYLVEGLAVALAAYFIPRRSMDLGEVAMIAVTAAAVFAILDLYAPTAASAARTGAGFGIGAMQVGFQGIAGLPGVPLA